MNAQPEESESDPVAEWLQRKAKDRDWKYCSYANPEAFKKLWNNSARGENANTVLLIDWNGFPAKHEAFPRIVDFITPLDWTLANAYDRAEKNVPGNPPTVVIVDRRSHRHPGSFAVEMCRALVDALAHVHVFSALAVDGEDALALVKLIEGGAFPPQQEPRLGQLRALRQAWIGYTVQSRDHHDLNNVLGPLLLGGEVKDDLLAYALSQLTRWFHLRADTGGAPSGNFLLGGDLRNAPLDIVLIDDMAELGWTSCVEKLFAIGETVRVGSSDDGSTSGAKGGLRLVVATTPYAIFPRLSPDQTCPDIDKVLPLIEELEVELQALSSLPLPDGSQNAADDQIILIDLRLFSRSAQEESVFSKACVDAALRMVSPDKRFVKRWQDERFSFDALKILRNTLDNVSDWEDFRSNRESQYLEALTLFIRLLAQRYFTTPFILFSSTGKRNILEFLRPYDNVISAFDKPRIAGSTIEVVETREGLRKAVQTAGRLVQFRRSLRNLIDVASKEEGLQLPRLHSREEAPHVEIYLDETKDEDDSGFASAAVVLIYPNIEAANDLDVALATKQVGDTYLRWWDETKRHAAKRLNKIPFENNSQANYTQVAQYAPHICNIVKDHVLKFTSVSNSTVPAAFGIVVKRPRRDRTSLEQWDFDGSSHIDGIYNQMLRFLVESAIYELIPEILGRSDFTWRGFFPNRIRPKKQLAGGREEFFSANELGEREKFWGLEKAFHKHGTVRTYGPSSFRTLVEEIVRKRQWMNEGAARSGWRGAVGVALNSWERKPRTIHNLADWYAFMVGARSTKHLVGQDKLMHCQFTQRLDVAADKVLAAGVHASRRDRSRALSECFTALHDKQPGPDDLMKITMRRVIKHVVPTLTGEDMVELLRFQRESGTSQSNGMKKRAQTSSESRIQTLTPRAMLFDAAERRLDDRHQQPGNENAAAEVTTPQLVDKGVLITAARYVVSVSGFNPDWDEARIKTEVANAVALYGRSPFLDLIEVVGARNDEGIKCILYGSIQLKKWIEVTGRELDRYVVPWSIVLCE